MWNNPLGGVVRGSGVLCLLGHEGPVSEVVVALAMR